MLTREQTIKAIEELKANEWMALGGMSPEAQEFIEANKNKDIWQHNDRNFGFKRVVNPCSDSYTIYRLDPNYQLPEIETEYLEFDAYWRKFASKERLSINYKDDNVFHLSELPERIDGYQLEGFKFEGSDMIYSIYHAWKDGGCLCTWATQTGLGKKVFALKVVYKKIKE